MKNFFSVFLILVSYIAQSQDCKYDIKKVDEFTKNTILQTKSETLSKSFNTYTSVSCKKVNDLKYLVIFIENTKLFSVDESKEVMLLTSGDEVIKFNFSQYDISNRKYNSTTGLTTYTITQSLVLSDENFEKLKKSNISKIRIQTTDGNIDSDVKEKWWKKVSELFNCI